MRHDRLYLDDIVEAAEAIGRFLADVPEANFLASDLLQSAVKCRAVKADDHRRSRRTPQRGVQDKRPARPLV